MVKVSHFFFLICVMQRDIMADWNELMSTEKIVEKKTVRTTARWMRPVELLNDWNVYGIENGKRFINKWKDFISWWMPLWLQPHDLPSTSTICRHSDALNPNTWKMFKVRYKHLASLFTIHCLLCYCLRYLCYTHTHTHIEASKMSRSSNQDGDSNVNNKWQFYPDEER